MAFIRLRAYIGFQPVRRTLPNSTHYALAALQHASAVGPLITQNVDGLHHAALRRILPEPEVDRRPPPPAHTLAITFRSNFPFSPAFRNFGGIHNLIAKSRKCIVDMDTSTHAQCFKSGLAKPTHAGTRSSPSWSAQARSPRQIPMAMLRQLPFLPHCALTIYFF